jgi:hypothetical protein
LPLAYNNGMSIAEVLVSAEDTVCGNAALHETFVTVTPKERAA